jgi:hypothetical protein
VRRSAEGRAGSGRGLTRAAILRNLAQSCAARRKHDRVR